MKTSRILMLLVCLSLVFTLASCELFDTLKEARADAIAKVEALAADEAYASLDKADVQKVVDSAKETIEKAATAEGIEKAVTIAKNSLDKLVLDGVKANAKAELKNYVDLSLYSEANKAVIEGKIKEASAAIDKCADENAVAEKVSAAKAELDAIKPALDEAKEAAKATLDSYVDLTLYSAENKASIEAAISQAKTDVDACTTIEAVSARLNSAKEAIDAVPTLLDTAKNEASSEIESYITDYTVYSEENKAVIERIIADAKANIEAATSEELLETIVDDAKTDIDEVLTIAEEYAIKAQTLKNIMVSVSGGEEDLVSEYVKIDENGYLVIDTVDLDATSLYFGEQNNNYNVVFDTYLKVDYRNVDWSAVSIRFSAWDESLNYTMVMKHGSTEFNKFTGNSVSSLLTKGSSGVPDCEIIHLQIIRRDGWLKSVLVNGECVFKISEGDYTVGRIYIRTWQAGVTLINPVYTEYASTAELEAAYGAELAKDCINKSEAELLAEAQTAAKNEIASYLQDVESNYSVVNQAVIAGIIEAGNTAIDACTSIDMVNAAVAEIKAKLDAVYTIAEDTALAEAKTAAKAEIASYLQDVESNYSETNQTAIAEIIAAAEAAIDECGSVAEVEAKVVAVKQQLDTVLTLAEEANAALLTKREEGVTEINAYLTDVETLYSEAKQAEIAEILSAGALTINSCETEEAVDTAVAAIKAELDAVLTLEGEQLAADTAMAEEFLASLKHTSGTNLLATDDTGAYTYASIEDGKLVFNTKVASLDGQFQFGTQSGNTNNIFDTKLTINYNSTYWDYVTIRFGAWDTSGNFKMVIKHDSINVYYCKYGQSDVLLTTHASGIANGTKVHLQILSYGWTNMVVLDGVCIFSCSENLLNGGFTMINPRESGLVFYQPVYKVFSTQDEMKAEYADVINKTCVNTVNSTTTETTTEE